MASRRLVPASVREALLWIPSDISSLERNYLLADDNLDLIGTRRRPENRLGLALHIALLRHRHCHANRVGPQRPAWIPFQAAALAVSHTLNASFRNRLNLSLLHK